MNKFITALCLALICGVFLRAAFSKPQRVSDLASAQATGSGASAAAAKNCQTTGNDGKTVLAPDGKEVLGPEGKEVLAPEGKEVLPPVGESIGTRSPEVSPFYPAPPVEYLGKAANRLLSPPSPVNVSGPVVSSETR